MGGGGGTVGGGGMIGGGGIDGGGIGGGGGTGGGGTGGGGTGGREAERQRGGAAETQRGREAVARAERQRGGGMGGGGMGTPRYKLKDSYTSRLSLLLPDDSETGCSNVCKMIQNTKTLLRGAGFHFMATPSDAAKPCSRY